jgi:hypothetical protein
MVKRVGKIALVQMPIAFPTLPPLGLALLKAGLERNGLDARVYHLNMRFAEQFDSRFYLQLSAFLAGPLAGEWIFSEALWGESAERDAAYVSSLRRQVDQRTVQGILRARNLVEPFLSKCLDEVPWEQYAIIGFTSIFQQHTASLALAKAIKQRWPHVRIVFGGANCEGPMAMPLLRNFSFVDAVFSGESDETLPMYAKGSQSNKLGRVDRLDAGS